MGLSGATPLIGQSSQPLNLPSGAAGRTFWQPYADVPESVTDGESPLWDCASGCDAGQRNIPLTATGQNRQVVSTGKGDEEA